MEESVVDLTLLVRQKRPLRLIWSSPRLSYAASLYANGSDSPPIPLPPSPDPPEALGKLPDIGMAIPTQLFKGRASRGLSSPGKNSRFRMRMEGVPAMSRRWLEVEPSASTIVWVDGVPPTGRKLASGTEDFSERRHKLPE